MSSDLKRTADLYLPLVRSTVNHPSVTMCSAPTSPQCYLCGLVGPGGGDISVCTFTADIQHWLHVVRIADNIIMLFFLTDTSTMTSWPLTCGTSLDFFLRWRGCLSEPPVLSIDLSDCCQTVNNNSSSSCCTGLTWSRSITGEDSQSEEGVQLTQDLLGCVRSWRPPQRLPFSCRKYASVTTNLGQIRQRGPWVWPTAWKFLWLLCSQI